MLVISYPPAYPTTHEILQCCKKLLVKTYNVVKENCKGWWLVGEWSETQGYLRKKCEIIFSRDKTTQALGCLQSWIFLTIKID